MKAWSGKTFFFFFFLPPFQGGSGSVCSLWGSRAPDKGCVWFQVGLGTAGAHYAGAAGAACAAAVSAGDKRGKKTHRAACTAAGCAARSFRVPRSLEEEVALGWLRSFLVGCVSPNPPSPIPGWLRLVPLSPVRLYRRGCEDMVVTFI